MENLEKENKYLKNTNESNEKIYNNELNDMNLISIENENLKNEISNQQIKVKNLELKTQKSLTEKDDEIELINNQLKSNFQSLSKIKKEKNEEISQLKGEIIKNKNDINILIKSGELLKSENLEIKNNNLMLQNKLEKKTKEFQKLNESAKKLIENKDKIIKEYENKIEEINKEKYSLIEQNHILLEKVKTFSSQCLSDILKEEKEEEDNKIILENNLLKSEIKSLKEKIQNQSNDLISLDFMEKEVIRLKLENEQLSKDYKNIKIKLRLEEEKNDFKKIFKKKKLYIFKKS